MKMNCFFFSLRIAATKRVGKIVSKQNELDESDHIPTGHELIATVDESTDDDGSMNYVEDYELNENGDDDGAFFVEYVTEEEENLITGENNETEYEANQFNEYADSDEAIDELYNCNLCGMNFKSITEHVEEYHSGQDVLIDISDESSAVVKVEQRDPLEMGDNENEGDSLITSDNVGMNNDGELIVYGEESLENENDLLEEMAYEEDQSEVYTYDGETGSITRANVSKQFNTNTANVCFFFSNSVSLFQLFFVLPFHSEYFAEKFNRIIRLPAMWCSFLHIKIVMQPSNLGARQSYHNDYK